MSQEKAPRFLKRLVPLWVAAGIVMPVGAQPVTPPPAAQQEPPSAFGNKEQGQDSELLGPYFESQRAAIAFRPPAGAKEIRRVGNSDEIVMFVNDQKEYQLKLSLLRFSRPMPLVAKKTDPTLGLLEITTEKLKEAPSAEVVRSDLTNVSGKGIPDTGLLAVRFLSGTKYKLTQQAIIQFSDRPDQASAYYLLDLTSPGSKPGTPAAEAIQEEKAAVEVFSAIVDSIKLLNREDVRREQDQQLFRTRTLYVNWTPTKLKASLTPERWLRLIQDGKDIGYSYVIEEESERAKRSGLLVGVRSRTVQGEGDKRVQVDAESMLFTSFDRRYEEWSNVAQETTKSGKKPMTELGTSVLEDRRVLDRDVIPGDEKAKDPNQPGTRREEDYRLTVTYTSRTSAPPIEFSLPPYYLPQALGHLLPRLVPLNEPKTYQFASYVGEQRAIMRRYVEVQTEKEVTLAGRTFRAVTVSDRIGLEGAPTFHYLTKSGEYMGSESPVAKIVILPADSETIQKIWANSADLSRPEAPRRSTTPPQR